MNVAAVQKEIGQALGTIPGLRVSDYTAQRITPPAAIVAWPSEVTFDETFGRGADSMTLEVFVVVGAVDARASRDTLAEYLNTSGPKSVKNVVDGFGYASCDSIRVTNAKVETLQISDVDYLAAIFELHIFG